MSKRKKNLGLDDYKQRSFGLVGTSDDAVEIKKEYKMCGIQISLDDMNFIRDYAYFNRLSLKEALADSVSLLRENNPEVTERPEKQKQKEKKRSRSHSKGKSRGI